MSESVTRESVHEMWRQLLEPAAWIVCGSELRQGLGVVGIARNGVGLVVVIHNSVLTVLDAAVYPGGEALIATTVAEAQEWGNAGLHVRLEIAETAVRLAHGG